MTGTECTCPEALEMAEKGFPIKVAPATRPGQEESYNLLVPWYTHPRKPPELIPVPIDFCPWCGEPLSEANC